MKLRLIALTALATGLTALICHQVRVLRERNAAVSSTERYQIPMDATPVVRDTVIGEIKLIAAPGRYAGAGILVFLPKGFTLTPEMIQAFSEATGDQFHIYRIDGVGTIILAGLDYHAYVAGRMKGHWKESSALRLEVAAVLLGNVIADAYERRAACVS